MDLNGRVAVITGAGRGIGAAIARRIAAEGATVLVTDVDERAAAAVAAEIGGSSRRVDVSSEAENVAMVRAAEEEHGRVDLLCCNAGVPTGGGVDADPVDWQLAWDVNVMAHVHAVRAALPGMLERGEGYLLHTASAAGLLTNIGAAPYSVTKHAVVALAEWLSVTHGEAGIRVSCLCPQFVETAMLDDFAAVVSDQEWVRDIAVTPEVVAEAVAEGIADERFLILPHPEVAGYFQYKATEYDRWLAGMRRLQRRLLAEG
jgi:NAD(P)-dependent dehydrogenase (short-subunit alcohol dehydrogenase family)